MAGVRQPLQLVRWDRPVVGVDGRLANYLDIKAGYFAALALIGCRAKGNITKNAEAHQGRNNWYNARRGHFEKSTQAIKPFSRSTLASS